MKPNNLTIETQDLPTRGEFYDFNVIKLRIMKNT